MKRLKIIVLLIIIGVIVAVAYYYNSIELTAYVDKGVIDYATFSGEDEVIHLNGEWEFYGEQFLESEDFSRDNSLEPLYVKVPGNWQTTLPYETNHGRGYGTYRLVINNIEQNKGYGLKTKNIRVACRIYVDGQLLVEDGVISSTEAGEVMGNLPKIIPIESTGDSMEIIIQVSCYQYFSGGIVEPLEFGDWNSVFLKYWKDIIFDAMNMTVLLTIGIVYIFLVLTIPNFTERRLNSFQFVGSLLMFAIGNAVLSERLLMLLLDSVAFDVLIRLEYVCIAGVMMAVYSFVYTIEPKLIPKIVKNIMISILIVLSITIVFVPMTYYNVWITFTYLTVLSIAVGLCIILFKYIFDKGLDISIKEQSFILGIFFALSIYALDITLLTIGVSYDMNLAVVFASVYGVIWFYFLVYRYQESYRQNQEMSIENEKSELAFLQAQIKPHFIFNTMNTIASIAIIDGNKARDLIIKLSDFLRQSIHLDSSEDMVYLEEELIYIQNYFYIEQVRYQGRLKLIVDIEDQEGVRLPRLMLQPLVENAIKHGILKGKEKGIIEITGYQGKDGYMISVRDNGIGLTEEKIAEIYEGKVESESGIGLANIQKRLRQLYQTELMIEGKVNKGTIITMKILKK